MVLCDDLGVGDVSSSGNPIVRTPRLDAFRSSGASLGRQISGPLCSPARACLLTGQYQYRSRVTDTYCGRSLLDPAVRVLPELLAGAGYRTGCFGKWHLGDNCPFRPQDRGFQRTVVHGSGGIGQPGDAPENAGRASYFDPVLLEDGHPRRFAGHCTEIFARECIRFIQEDRQEPWFAFLAFNAPHTPLQADPARVADLQARGAGGDLAALYALVEDLDARFGEVLDAIESCGQTQNTVVLFTSDHGPCPGVTDAEGRQRFNAGLRGQKGHVYEGGVRVPAFWRWPGQWPLGERTELTTHVIDVLPTLLECAGVSYGGPLDGMSLGPVLAGAEPGAQLASRDLFIQWHRGDRPVPMRNAAVWRGHHKWLRVCEAGQDELYDLSADPGETHPLADADLSRSLRESYLRWLEDVSQPHDFDPLRIHLGDPREKEVALSRQDWRMIGPDGWSSQHLGWWPLDVVTQGEYRIVVEFESTAPEAGSVVLDAGDHRLVQPALPGVSVYSFEAISLACGPLALCAQMHTRFAWQSPVRVRAALA